VSHLVAPGASVKTCQTLARHSTPSMTISVYAKASLHDIKGAVDAPPDPTPRGDGPRDPGRDRNRPGDDTHKQTLWPPRGTFRCGRGRLLA
jgi:hypothetical protein